MSASELAVRSLVRLYPRSFRERWGDAVEDECRAAGWRTWPGVLGSALDMWLHPAMWPADSRELRQKRALVLTVTVASLVWLVTYALTETDDALAVHLAHLRTLPYCFAALLAGLVLILPRPGLRPLSLLLFARVLAGRLAPGVLLGAFVVVAANGALPGVAHSALRPVLLAAWWLALALAAIGACRAFATLSAQLAPPRPRHVRASLAFLIGSTALTAATILQGATGPDARSIGVRFGAGALVAGTALFAVTLRDLRTLPPSSET